MLRLNRQRRDMDCGTGEALQAHWDLSATRCRPILSFHAVSPRPEGAGEKKIQPLEK